MTIGEMHASILLEIDKVGSYSTSNLISGEIDDYINSSIRDFVNQNRRYLRDYLELSNESKEAIENLRTLETQETISSIIVTTDLPNGFNFDLSELPSYDYYVSGRVFFPTGEYWKDTKVVNRSYLDSYSKTKYNYPVFNSIPVIIDDSQLIGLYGADDNEIPSKAVITYIKQPKKVSLDNNVSSDLPEDTHRQIVKIASQKIIRSLVQQKDESNRNAT